MKILLAPSETKKRGGYAPFSCEDLLFDSLLPVRKQLVERYCEILRNGSRETLANLFGLTRTDAIDYYASRTIRGAPAMPAIQRYTGVAFDHLDYPTLSKSAQTYLDRHLILHSNLFGLLRAGDPIPEYRLKQGEPVGELQPERLYRDSAAALLEAYIGDDDLLDLRARFYEQVYKPNRPYTVLKFLKGGKVVSHWAKAYRGLVVRAIAEAGVERLEDFIRLPIEGLEIVEIQTRKHRTEIVYAIHA
jgi:cytoplasmic iron level regulating protein YaaA (DUF328/UPF0246 family)